MKKEMQYVGCNCSKQACHPGSLLAGVSLGSIRKGKEPLRCIGRETAEDPGQKPSGMTALSNIGPALPLAPCGRGKRRHGFTLIEILVVVLIIGILAAVALPQYQKAVRKTRVAEAKIILKQLTDAQDIYILSHVEIPEDTSIDGWNEVLDVQFPRETKYWQFTTDDCTYEEGKVGCANLAIPTFETNSYGIYYASPNYSDTFSPGHFFCTKNESICKSLGGIDPGTDGLQYILQ